MVYGVGTRQFRHQPVSRAAEEESEAADRGPRPARYITPGSWEPGHNRGLARAQLHSVVDHKNQPVSK